MSRIPAMFCVVIVEFIAPIAKVVTSRAASTALCQESCRSTKRNRITESQKTHQSWYAVDILSRKISGQTAHSNRRFTQSLAKLVGCEARSLWSNGVDFVHRGSLIGIGD